MISRISRAFFIVASLLFLITRADTSASAQTDGAISGNIKWEKSIGIPQSPRAGDMFKIEAYSEKGELVGKGVQLKFSETRDSYNVFYNITNLPEGRLIRVSVTLADGFRWVGGPARVATVYHRIFKPAGWSGDVVLMRVRADIPSRARGDFEVVLAAGRPPEKILTNPKPRLPYLQRPQQDRGSY